MYVQISQISPSLAQNLQLVYLVWLIFEIVFCYFFIIETKNVSFLINDSSLPIFTPMNQLSYRCQLSLEETAV